VNTQHSAFLPKLRWLWSLGSKSCTLLHSDREDLKAGMEVAQGPRDAHPCLPRLLAAVGVVVNSESRAKTNGAF
jgi:hypothetical protein